MVLLPAFAPARLPALVQCPDGTPPPCARAAVVPPRAGSVAVLYITARDTADAYLADGLTEDLTTLLARSSGLIVKPSSTVRLAQRRQPAAPASTLGRALNVRYVLQGSLRRTGEQVRLNVELVETGADRSVWGETYDRRDAAMLDLPGELADEVTRRVRVPSAASAPTAPAPRTTRAVWATRNPAALDHFRRGNYLLATRVREAEAFGEYQAAARLDPGFTSAVARSAYALALQWNRAAIEAGSRTDTVRMRDLGLSLASQALRMDSSNSDAWMALGYLRALADLHTLAGAEQAFERAVALDPANAEAWHQYGQILAFLGDDSASVRALQRALALEPARAISLADLAFYVYTAFGDAEQAFTLVDSSLSINPEFVFGRALRALAALQLRRPADALSDADAIEARDSLMPVPAMLRTAAHAMLGDSGRARAAARAWLRPNAGGGIWGALAMLSLGDRTWALEHLACIPPSERNASLWAFLRMPEFNPLRAEPRYLQVYRDSRPVGARAP